MSAEDSDVNALLWSLSKSTTAGREVRRRNRVAAIVVDTCRDYVQAASSTDAQTLPAGFVGEMLDGVLAALVGHTDWSDLRVIDPLTTPLACARIQALLDEGN